MTKDETAVPFILLSLEWFYRLGEEEALKRVSEWIGDNEEAYPFIVEALSERGVRY